ncbi:MULTISPECIES: hypothetical protein [Salinibaculum]|uniref:hypothetical protein n=1 Tax=Salinibaculum TaxID=2732368 RepID=UPI0030CEFE15
MSDDEDADDPFEELDEAVADREGDPFDSLDGPRDVDDETDADEAATGETDDIWAPDREEQLGGPVDADDEPDSPVDGEREGGLSTGTDQPDGQESSALGGGGATDVDPFAGVDQREGDPFEAFERMDVGDVDADSVWESLAAAEEGGSVAQREGQTYAEVSKHSFCERCEHFSAPPDVGCGHEGTEILEFVDLETVRLVDCPVVEERRKLQQE